MPHPFPVLGKGAGFDFTYFLLVSRPPEPFNPHLTVQFLIPVMHCYSLHNLILASYSPSCISNAVLAESFRDLRGQRIPRPCRGVSALDWSFSVFPNLQLSTLDLTSFLSPLAATLMDLPASVANKRLTAWLSSLDATLTKNRRGGGCYCPSWSHLHTGTLPRPISFVCRSYENRRVCTQSSHSGRGCTPNVQMRILHPEWRCGTFNLQTFKRSSRPIAAQGPWCHNWQRCTKFFPIRGNNSAPPGV